MCVNKTQHVSENSKLSNLIHLYLQGRKLVYALPTNEENSEVVSSFRKNRKIFAGQESGFLKNQKMKKSLQGKRVAFFKKSEDEKIFAGQESFGSLFHIPPLWGQRRRLSCDQASFWGGGGNQINSLELGLLCQQVGRGDIKLPHLGKCNSLKVSDMEIGLFAAAGHPS